VIAFRAAAVVFALLATGCGASVAADSDVYSVAQVIEGFTRGGLPVREPVEGEVPCEEVFGQPEPGEESDGCFSDIVWTRGRPPGTLLLPVKLDRLAFSVFVHPSAEGLEHQSGPQTYPDFAVPYENLVAGNVVVSVLDDELVSRVEQILDDL
jgi:hypothetical protein